MRIGSPKIDRMNALFLFSLNAIHLVVVLMMVSASLMAAEPPNTILCMADDMGWGDPGYNSATVTLADGVTPHPDRGWISTPVLDEMASTGIRFDRFYAASAVCSPTRASCLTGRNPFRSVCQPPMRARWAGTKAPCPTSCRISAIAADILASGTWA